MPTKIICFIVFLLTSGCCFSYVISFPKSLEGTEFAENAQRLFKVIYYPLGIEPEFVFYPSTRGLNLVDKGEIDAEAVRINIIGDKFENLIRVNVVLGKVTVGFFCVSEELCNVTANSSIAVLSGFEAADEMCTMLGLKCQYVSEPINIAKMLENGLVDAFFATATDAEHAICAVNSESVFFAQNKELNFEFYHYINRKHFELKPKLETAISLLKTISLFPSEKSVEQLTSYDCGKSVKII